MYLIIDIDYNITKSEALTYELNEKHLRGEISIVHLETMRGQNLDGTWSDINEEGSV